MVLPESFLDKMKELLEDDYEDFIKSYEAKAYSGLRVNTNKISVEEFKTIAPFDIKQIPFIDNGFYINDEDEWSKHPYYFAGLYYLQEPSAMLPANRLPIDVNDKVLDLCAAPGGKSTELSAKGSRLLISNDISYKRAIPLVKNLEVSGADNSYVICEDPNRLSTIFPEFFDKILVDAPCSGEGMFRKDNGLIASYIEKGPEDYADLQKEILENAYRMLKPGGLMLYSTCTFSDIEDELVILNLLENHEDMQIEKLQLNDGFSSVYDKYTDKNEQLSACVHIFPHKVKGEGHFLALLKKKSSNVSDIIGCETVKFKEKDNRVKKSGKNNTKSVNLLKFYEDLPKEIIDFLERFSVEKTEEFKNKRYLMQKDGLIYMLPECEEMYKMPSLRYLRTGVLIGTFDEKKGFVPHTSMALAKGNNCFSNCLNLDSKDEFVYRFLRGETLVIPLEDDRLSRIQKGICLICVDGFSLGFAKFDGSKFKNLYEKGWRLV